MKIQVTKKTVIIVLVIFIVLCALIFILLLKGQFGKNYPKEPLRIESLGTTKLNIDLSEIEFEAGNDIPVYSVERKLHTKDVEKFISDLGLSLTRKDISVDSYIEWSDSSNQFTYDSIADTLTFQIMKSTNIGSGEGAFRDLYLEYFDKEYTFVLNNQKKNSDGGVTYYASRVLNEVPLESGYGYEYSDTLTYDKKGNLESGVLSLAEITKTEFVIPLISDTDIKKYVNIRNYPKESYLDTGVLQGTLGLDYLSDAWEGIENSAKDCKGSDKKLILLLKNTDQGYLLPVYRVDSNCSVSYEKNSYSVPAVFYLNATDTDYITTETL